MRENMLADLLERARMRSRLRELRDELRAISTDLTRRGMPDESVMLNPAIDAIRAVLPKIGGGVEDAGQVFDELNR